MVDGMFILVASHINSMDQNYIVTKHKINKRLVAMGD